MTTTRFHEGELATQRRAGVETAARRLEGMLEPTLLSGGAAKFLALQTFAALTARDSEGRLWVSPLAGPPGFLRGEESLLQISVGPREGDPLGAMSLIGQSVGLIAIDFDGRRRMRINGVVADNDGGALSVRVEQAYGNCPKYIHPHAVDATALRAAGTGVATRQSVLDPSAQTLIAASDTFFLGTTHPTRGSDASHRGGPPGFVRVESASQLWWPDYPGNNMFNSFGNLAVDDEAALLFVDFPTGTSLHVSGRAQVQWTQPGTDGDDGGVGRRVSFSVESVVRVDPYTSLVAV